MNGFAQISGAVSLSGVYWSSTEYSVTQAHSVQFSNGLVMQTSKGGAIIYVLCLHFKHALSIYRIIYIVTPDCHICACAIGVCLV